MNAFSFTVLTPLLPEIVLAVGAMASEMPN